MVAKLTIPYFILATTILTLYSLPKPCLGIDNRRVLTTSKEVINQYLTPHNKVRARLGLPPLKWSEQLASYARWWAHQRQGDCAMIHSGTNYGENLFWGSTGREWGAQDAVAYWAGEYRFYDYYTNRCEEGEECLHYTQIIWKQSKRVGCAKFICYNGFTFISCNYDPHGNVLGQKPF